MIKKTPLCSNQYAVLMADGATGHLLTTKGNLCLNGEDEVHVVFEDLETARKFIEQKQEENDTWEFVICDSNNECVEHWEARKWEH